MVTRDEDDWFRDDPEPLSPHDRYTVMLVEAGWLTRYGHHPTWEKRRPGAFFRLLEAEFIGGMSDLLNSDVMLRLHTIDEKADSTWRGRKLPWWRRWL